MKLTPGVYGPQRYVWHAATVTVARQGENIREALSRSGDTVPEGLIFVDRNPVFDLEAPTSQWPKIIKMKRLGLIDGVMMASPSRMGSDFGRWGVPGELENAGALEFADICHYPKDSLARQHLMWEAYLRACALKAQPETAPAREPLVDQLPVPTEEYLKQLEGEMAEVVNRRHSVRQKMVSGETRFEEAREILASTVFRYRSLRALVPADLAGEMLVGQRLDVSRVVIAFKSAAR